MIDFIFPTFPGTLVACYNCIMETASTSNQVFALPLQLSLVTLLIYVCGFAQLEKCR